MKIVLCDDEPVLLAYFLPLLAARYPQAEIVSCLSGEELLEPAYQGDILILDVQMPGMSGMEAAKELRRRGSQSILIFLTGREDLVFDAFQYETFRYLVKPVSEETLFDAIDAAIRKFKSGLSAAAGKEFVVNSDGAHIRVRMSDIRYAEVNNRRICLHTTSGEIGYYGRLSELEAFAGDGFFRTHRSYLVNLGFVDHYSAKEIRLQQDTVYIAKKNYAAFVEAYLSYLKSDRYI